MRFTAAFIGIMRGPILLLSVAHCAVEAGNPHGTGSGSKSAIVRIHMDAFQQGIGVLKPGDGKLNLVLQNIQLLGEDSAQEIGLLTPKGSTIDVGQADANGLVLLAEGSAPISDAYRSIRLNFAGNEVGFWQEQAGARKALVLQGAEARAVSINQDFTLSESEANDIYVSLDFATSVRRQGDSYILDPRIGLVTGAIAVSYQGTTTDSAAEYVCAYVHAPQIPIPPPPPVPLRPATQNTQLGLVGGVPIAPTYTPSRPPFNPPPPSPLNPPPPLSPPLPSSIPSPLMATPRVVFQEAGQVVKDDSHTCPNAFDRRPVVSGRYLFPRLIPGTYDFRLFRRDGTFVDIGAGVLVRR